MKRKTPFKISRCERFGDIIHYEINHKDDMLELIVKLITKQVLANGIKSKRDPMLLPFLRDMTDLYGKFLDHYDLTYNFVLYHKKVAQALRENGISGWAEDEPAT